ncbi:hypothetical protein [Piscinibacter sp.]|uniref:hypothetical protein n=1 Tax=Piscinibacter sp. TaxID=1903157 RepID=UPI002F417097
MNKPTLMLCCAAAVLLAACGGRSEPAPAVTDAIPDTASQSSAGLVTYLSALSKATPEDKDPLDLSTFNPVQPEDTEPEPLI